MSGTSRTYFPLQEYAEDVAGTSQPHSKSLVQPCKACAEINAVGDRCAVPQKFEVQKKKTKTDIPSYYTSCRTPADFTNLV